MVFQQLWLNGEVFFYKKRPEMVELYENLCKLFNNWSCTHIHTQTLTDPSQNFLTIEHFSMSFLVLYTNNDDSRKILTTKTWEAPLTKVKLIFTPMKMRIICAGRIHFNFYFTHSMCINRQELAATTWLTHITTPSSSSSKNNKTNQPKQKNETVRNTVLIE